MPRRPWAQFDLEPVASLVTPGTILFLNGHPEALQHRVGAKLTFGALCHPCIAIDTNPFQRRVKIIIVCVEPSARCQH